VQLRIAARQELMGPPDRHDPAAKDTRANQLRPSQTSARQLSRSWFNRSCRKCSND
jgi:hypothetical protein